MELAENHTLKTFRGNVAAVNKVLSIFTAEDYYVMIKKGEIIFNDKVKKLLAEKISENPDHFLLLDEIRIIFSGELSDIDFVFKVVKRQGDNFYKQSFIGVATNYFLADILGMSENRLKVFKLYLKEEGDFGNIRGFDEKTFRLSLNKYSSDVCESVPLW